MANFDTLHTPILITRKIWEAEILWNFHTVLMTYPFTITENQYAIRIIRNCLQLLTELQEGLATCASWDLESHRWSTFGCQLVGSNGTHSKCSCRQLSTFALLAPSGKAHFNMRGIGSTIGGSGAHNDILIGVLAAFLLVLLLLLVVVMACFCRRRKVFTPFCAQFLKTQLSPFWSSLTSSLHFCLSICI